MRVFGDYNNISDELKKKLKQLKPGEFARFKLLESVRIQDPETKEVTIRFPHRQLWAKDMILDPYSNDGNGGLVQIGVVANGGWNAREKEVTAVEWFEFNEHKTGIMFLDGSKAKDREMFEFLQLTNMVEDGILGDHRDKSVQILFKLMDSKKEAIKRNKLFDLKAEAFVYIKNLDAAEARDLAAALNWNYEGDLDEIIVQIKEYADKSPQEFSDKIVDPLLKKKAIIRKAMGSMITYDVVNHSIKWSNGTVLANLERKTGQNEIDALAEWLDTVQNGDKILAQLKKAKATAAAIA